MPRIPPWITIPPTLRRLTVHASAATDDDVRHALAACPDRLETLGLRGTPVSDRLLAELARFAGLRYLDAVDTDISPDTLAAFAADRPRLGHHPRATASKK